MKPLTVPKRMPNRSNAGKIIKEFEKQKEKMSPPLMLPSVRGAINFAVIKSAAKTIMAEATP